MGIYISGVKGLPEQVQENKNKIKEVEEQIEGIDFEAVRELQGQVAENTQDINNLEASIGVQNQTINALGDRTTALERKTQLMSYNDDLSMTDFRNSIEVADDVYASSVRVQGDGSIVNTTQSGMHFKEGANDDVLTIANNDGATPHYLHFNGDGTLDIDGQPVGGATLYEHNIQVTRNTGNIRWEFDIRLITTFPEAFASATAFDTWLYAKYGSEKHLTATGYYIGSTPNVTTLYNIYYSVSTLAATGLEVNFTNSIVSVVYKTLNLTSTNITLIDVVKQIS